MTRGSLTRFRVFELSTIVALASGCGARSTEQRCDELREEIMAALQQNVQQGVLIPTAIPCGEIGVANRDDYFHERLRPSDIRGLQTDFRAACDEFAASCSGSLEPLVASESSAGSEQQ